MPNVANPTQSEPPQIQALRQKLAQQGYQPPEIKGAVTELKRRAGLGMQRPGAQAPDVSQAMGPQTAGGQTPQSTAGFRDDTQVRNVGRQPDEPTKPGTMGLMGLNDTLPGLYIGQGDGEGMVPRGQPQAQAPLGPPNPMGAQPPQPRMPDPQAQLHGNYPNIMRGAQEQIEGVNRRMMDTSQRTENRGGGCGQTGSDVMDLQVQRDPNATRRGGSEGGASLDMQSAFGPGAPVPHRVSVAPPASARSTLPCKRLKRSRRPKRRRRAARPSIAPRCKTAGRKPPPRPRAGSRIRRSRLTMPLPSTRTARWAAGSRRWERCRTARPSARTRPVSRPARASTPAASTSLPSKSPRTRPRPTRVDSG